MTAPTRTIVFLTTAFDVGGAERVMIHAAAGLRRRGWRVIVAGLEVRTGQVARELQSAGVEVMSLGISRHLGLLAVPLLAWRLRRLRADVLYTFLIHAHVVGRLAGALAGTPVLLSSQQVMAWEGRPAEWLNRLTARWCTRVVAVSHRVQEYLEHDVGLPAWQLTTISNCVDVDRFAMAPPDFSAPLVVGSVARLSAEKDHESLLVAFVEVRRQRPDARLLIAGSGPERPRLEQRVVALGLGEAVEFLGHVVDVRTVLRQLQVFVQSSHVEGLPVAVLEALASGRPVIAAAVGGNDEAVVDGVTGLLVPPASPAALAQAILRVADDPAFAESMARAGREHVSRFFSADAMVNSTEALLNDLADRRQGGRSHQ